MNAKVGWLVKPSRLVELQGLLDGQIEGADQNGVKDGGHGDEIIVLKSWTSQKL